MKHCDARGDERFFFLLVLIRFFIWPPRATNSGIDSDDRLNREQSVKHK